MTREEYGSAFEKGFQKTVGVLRRNGAEVELAKDIAQAAWMRGWEHIDDLREAKALEAWVISIARRLLISLSRRKGIMVPLETPGAERPDEDQRFDPVIIDLHRAVEHCTPRQRELIEAVYFGGETAVKAAEHLNMSPRAAHTELYRARGKMRSEMTRKVA